MRSAKQAHLSTIGHAAPRLLLARVVIAVLATLALLVIWHPVVVHAQEATSAALAKGAQSRQQPPAAKDTAPTTHTVKAGETLWSIATRYYGDGHQWRAVARRNGIALSSDTALRIGRNLVLPSRRAVAASASTRLTRADTATPRMATTPAAPALPVPSAAMGPVVTKRPSGALAEQTSGKANASSAKRPDADARAGRNPKTTLAAIPKTTVSGSDTGAMTPPGVMRPMVKAERMLRNAPARIGLVDVADLKLYRPAGESPTVFVLRVPDASIAAASANAIRLHAEPAARTGEYQTAPFPVAASRWTQAGRVIRRLDDAGSTMPEPKRMQLADQVEIAAPTGTTLSVGDRLVAVRRGGVLSPGVLVAVPTGILQVTKVDAGTTAHAYVRSVYGVVEQGEALFSIEGAAAPTGLRSEPVAGRDVETTVSWIDASELLPTLQTFLLLAAGQAQGVKAGEQFALVRPSATGGEERIAMVRVVRVGASGSTAIVIGQTLPEIASGVRARRVSRVP